MTSRAPLHLRGEHEFAVPPLALPLLSDLPDPAALEQVTAVRLFVERARDAKADFVLTPRTHRPSPRSASAWMACRWRSSWRLRASSCLRPRRCSHGCNNRLKLLTGGARDLPTRQQTLRGTIDWSYNLLDANEQRLFARLGVFVGGWTVEAAEAVCNADGDLGLDVLDGLQSLLDKSLLRQVEGADGEPRFTMLETIREYALERLAASGEAEAVQRQHTAYYLNLAEARHEASLNHVEVEYDNLRAALAWSHAQQAVDLAGRLTQALEFFWFARGHVSEGRRSMEAVLTLAQTVPLASPIQAVVSRMAGYFAYFQGDYAHAQERFEQSLALFQALADKVGLANLLINLGMVAEAQGDTAQAQALFEESLAVRQQVGDQYFIADSLYHLGRLLMLQGSPAKGQPLQEEALAMFQLIGPGMVPIATGVLGYTVLLQGDYQRGAILFRSALRELSKQRNTFMAPHQLIGLAGVCAAQQHASRAARLLGAAEGLAQRTGLRPSPGEDGIWQHIIASIHSQLDEPTFAAAWAEGQAMTLEQAIAYGLE